MEKADLELKSLALTDEVLELLNERLIRVHIADPDTLTAPDVIYIATSALAKVVAVTLTSQVEDPAMAQRLVDRWVDMFRGYAGAAQGTNLSNDDGTIKGGILKKSTSSAGGKGRSPWDIH